MSAPIVPPVVGSWENYGLTLNRNNNPHPNIANAVRVMQGVDIGVWYDEFLQKIIYAVDGKEREFADPELAALTHWFQERARIADIGKGAINDAVQIYARNNTRNCVKDWLDELVWDQVPRLVDLCRYGFGTEDSDYYRAVGRCFLQGMVLRVYQPGAEVKAMPVLEGPENIFKTRALQTIGGPYYAAANEKILDKDFLQLFPGKMLIDLSEMHSFSKVEIARIKSIISTPVDRYRESYGRYSQDHPRQCVFSGTTNRDDWNTSDTGATRFWPVPCGEISVDWLATHREQLFAEAVHRMRAGECHWDVPRTTHHEMTEDRRARDPWEDRVLEYCTAVTNVFIPDVLGKQCLDLGIAQQDNSAANRVRSILRTNGYTRQSVRVSGSASPVKAYKKAKMQESFDYSPNVHASPPKQNVNGQDFSDDIPF